MLGEPAGGLVVRVQTHLTFPLAALLRAPMRKPMLQTFASSCSDCASAITFWATWLGTSS